MATHQPSYGTRGSPENGSLRCAEAALRQCESIGIGTFDICSSQSSHLANPVVGCTHVILARALKMYAMIGKNIYGRIQLVRACRIQRIASISIPALHHCGLAASTHCNLRPARPRLWMTRFLDVQVDRSLSQPWVQHDGVMPQPAGLPPRTEELLG